MSKIVTADLILDSDEPTYGMKVYEEADGFCTKLTVIRNDLPVNLVIHHGPNEEFSGKIPPMFVPSVDGENPVGLMLQMSEQHRQDLRWFKRAEEMRQSSTLIQDAIAADEQARLAIKGHSTFGPLANVQRNPAYSHQTTRRNWWAERAERTHKTKHFKEMRIR